MSTSDPSGTEPEEGGRPSFDKQPPPSGSPYDSPPGYGGQYGAPAGSGSPYDRDQPPGYGPPPGAPGSPGGPGGPGDPYGSPHGGPGPGPGPVPGMPALGGWGARILARLVDYVMVQVIAVAVLLPFLHFNKQSGWIGSFWFSCALYLVYEGLMLSRDGQTLGKKLMKVRVAMLADGSAPTSAAAWTRAATFIVPALICCGGLWWAIDGLFGVFDKPYRQCVHDKAAKTVVVSTA
ncbi:RDD family protein [Kitasatospora fiedleri]|uniref:RDD family protein n=1 Tax=Kitasatospora fiedleri TaxID=2991545 RepID=UPI000C2B5A8A|nr:RDD family protein [Kitasatospora fiedleri]